MVSGRTGKAEGDLRLANEVLHIVTPYDTVLVLEARRLLRARELIISDAEAENLPRQLLCTSSTQWEEDHLGTENGSVLVPVEIYRWTIHPNEWCIRGHRFAQAGLCCQ